MTGPTPRANRAEMRQAVAAQIAADPSRSNLQIARALGVSDHTVASVRNDLETGGQIAKLTKRVRADGKSYGARHANDAKPKPVKVTFTLPPEDHATVEALAARHGDADAGAYARRLVVMALSAEGEER